MEDQKDDESSSHGVANESKESNENENEPSLTKQNGASLPPLQVPESIEEKYEAPSSPYLLIPSLRGRLVREGANVICRGVWAMHDGLHDQQGQTSEFEFKLVKAALEEVREYPVNGKYQGWFILKQQTPARNLKIDDKDMNMIFSGNENGGFDVKGTGSNRFGTFSLRGYLTKDNMVQLYREYELKQTPTAAGGKKRTAVGESGAPVSVPKKKTLIVAESPVVSPREGAGRMRKQSTLMQGYVEPTPTPKAAKPSKEKVATLEVPSTVGAPPSLVRQDTGGGRTPRLSHSLQKCGDLLKELMKYPSAVWFAEPVDYVKLNIMDYPKIITNPMDFRTIRENLDRVKYETPDQFADHMRLIFRNAVTYNQERTNAVNLAARELSSKFEEGFRKVMDSVRAPIMMQAEYPKLARASSGGSGNGVGPKKGSGKSPRGAGATKGMRLSAPISYASAPPVISKDSIQLQELLKKMEKMEDELQTLRTTVRKDNIKDNLELQRKASHDPLTYEEKKTLIAEINKLSEDRMAKVVEIIQAAHSPSGQRGEDEEIEIPLDELDTYTLRKLQDFVNDSLGSSKKKRPSTSATPGVGRSQGGATTKSEPSSKRPKKEQPGDGKSAYGYSALVGSAVPDNSVDSLSGIVGAPPESAAGGDDDHVLFNSFDEDSGDELSDGGDAGGKIAATAQAEAKAVDTNGEASISSVASSSNPSMEIETEVEEENVGDDGATLSESLAIEMEAVPVVVANADAWMSPRSQSNVTEISVSNNSTGSSSWNAAIDEVKEKEQRAALKFQEDERLAAEKQRLEAEKVEAARLIAQQQIEEQQRKEEEAANQQKEAARLLQEKREEERRLRAERAASKVVDENEETAETLISLASSI